MKWPFLRAFFVFLPCFGTGGATNCFVVGLESPQPHPNLWKTLIILDVFLVAVRVCQDRLLHP
jgi:hypothetical protein